MVKALIITIKETKIRLVTSKEENSRHPKENKETARIFTDRSRKKKLGSQQEVRQLQGGIILWYLFHVGILI